MCLFSIYICGVVGKLLNCVKSMFGGNEICMCGKTDSHYIRNEDMCKIKANIVGSVRTHALRWFGHMKRMNYEELTERMYSSRICGQNLNGDKGHV